MLIKGEERYQINGAAFEVAKTLGAGFNEKVYQDALEIEFQNRGIPYEREKRLLINYKGQILRHDFFVDFLCFGDIIVECKATKENHPDFISQVINYLKASNLPLGVLINFGMSKVQPEYIFPPKN